MAFNLRHVKNIDLRNLVPCFGVKYLATLYTTLHNHNKCQLKLSQTKAH